VPDLNIVVNNPDAAITAIAQAGQDFESTCRLCAEHAGRFDKVHWNGSACFIVNLRLTKCFDLHQLAGTKIHASVKMKDCS
jgi:hypothetical protein